ncbi:MAG: hypothetical protein Q7J32_12530 [Sphingomonadaceae bacterium]|nr:hypothetical protein [Sphingomonadaceae bacterium]
MSAKLPVRQRSHAELTLGVMLFAFLGAFIATRAPSAWWMLGLLLSASLMSFAAAGFVTADKGRRALLVRAAIVAVAPILLFAAGKSLAEDDPNATKASMITAAALFIWLTGLVAVRARTGAADGDLPEATAPDAKSVPTKLPWFMWATFGVGLVLLSLALSNIAIALTPFPKIWTWIATGGGVYWALLVASAILASAVSRSLYRAGAALLREGATNVERDRLWMLRQAGVICAAFGVALMLMAFWRSQFLAAPADENGQVEGIGFFDLATWLGTFATFVVVVASALVAMYVKRRDEESQHNSAVTAMRQAWIDKLRQNLAYIMAGAHRLRAAAVAKHADPSLAGKVRQALREIELQLNPTEGHHAVLLQALQSTLHEAGIEAHFQSRATAPQSVDAEFDVLSKWLVLLGQLVLKIEWAVTSQGRASVERKLGRLWNDLQAFEGFHTEELVRLASEAMRIRRDHANTLLNGANIAPAAMA